MSKILARCLLGLSTLLPALGTAAGVSIIPAPQHLQPGQGSYRLDAHTRLEAPNDARGREIAAFLREAIRAQTGIAVHEGAAAHGIVLKLDPAVQGDEAYRLAVAPQQVTISAATDKGLFWGVQTLRQLLPLEKAAHVEIPAVRIEDAPAYPWRSVMLDVSRHFYPVGFVEKQLDLLSYYKINTFHWHLTDDQGWRIEIKRYPKLTSVGAWRTEADGTRYGGFYTQAQIREVVDYARRRNITVIPEIEMPGHSVAAIAAYPELSCDKKQVAVTTAWGVHKNIDCVGDEGTFTFIENVLDEVLPLFPSRYVHIGGDEVPKVAWHDCASCQALMHKLGLKDEDGLQSYFIRRIQRWLEGKGKTLVGWDEILEGGADTQAVIEAWRGADEQAKALANGNRVVVAGPFYIDRALDSLTVKDVFHTDIADDSGPGDAKADAAVFAAHRAQLLGGEAPLDRAHLDRLAALIARYEPAVFSEHLAWSSHGGAFFNDLLPLPYDEASLARVCAHVEQAQAHLRCRLLLENPSTYLEFERSTLGEAQFLGDHGHRVPHDGEFGGPQFLRGRRVRLRAAQRRQTQACRRQLTPGPGGERLGRAFPKGAYGSTLKQNSPGPSDC